MTLDPNWRDDATILSIGPAMQECPHLGSTYLYAHSAEKYRGVIFMEVPKGYFSKTSQQKQAL